ncbi:MAG: DEAD/DEAH box helicase [Nitrosopumilaceae archaeon]
MAWKGIWLNKVKKAMLEAELEPISDLAFAWSKKDRILVVVDDRKTFYEVNALKVVYSEDKIRKVSIVEKARNHAELVNAIRVARSETANTQLEGVPIRDAHACIECILTMTEEFGKPTKQIVIPQTLDKLTYGNIIGYICDEKLQVTSNPIFLSENLLLHHIIVTGSTGGGKTEVAKRIVSEVERMGRKILVVTPEPHLWKSLENSHIMEGHFLDMDRGINVLDLSFSKNLADDAKTVIGGVLEEYSRMEQTDHVRLLLVIDEAHIFLEDEDSERVLEQAVRTLRKFGVACVLISHNYGDFNRTIRTNIQTHIAMYTNWSRDISYVREFQQKGGPDFAELLRTIPEGYGIFRSREFLRNQPFPCRFLKCYEVLQSSVLQQTKNSTTNDTYGRRLLVLEIIRENPQISTENIRIEIEKRGSTVPERTVYSDLGWLVEQKLVRVDEVSEKGKRHYTVSEN